MNTFEKIYNLTTVKEVRAKSKISKRESFEVIKGLCESLEQVEMSEDERIAYQLELSKLLRFFEPAKLKSKVKDWDNVALCCSKKRETGFALTFVYVSDGLCYATNGHILAWTSTTKADGFYHPNGIKVSDENGLEFPHVSALTEALPETQTCLDIVSESAEHKTITTVNGSTFDKKLYNLISTICHSETKKVRQTDKTSPLYVIGEKANVVLLPSV